MICYSLSKLADDTVLSEFDATLSHARTANATMLAYLAEVDERQLYRAAEYPSMRQYCVQEKHMSEDSALKRIRVARTAPLPTAAKRYKPTDPLLAFLEGL